MHLHRVVPAAAVAAAMAAALAGCAPAALAGSSVAVQQSVEDSADDSIVQTDLVNAKTALIAYLTATGDPLPADLPGDLANYGWMPSEDAGTLVYTRGDGANDGSFCLVETGAVGRAFVVTSNTPVAPGSDCPEAY